MTTTVVSPGEGRSILDGFVIFKLLGADTGGTLAIVEHTLSPGRLAAPIHTHRNEDEYSYVLEGEITALIGGELIRAPAGTLVCKPRNIPHTFWNASSSP
ncbi:MAG TPA: cupin domain-containing protein, partial [Roseiflexaceae bacterium]|nr:cupin domain-containing protein [Roseiflexaceae bacterium]